MKLSKLLLGAILVAALAAVPSAAFAAATIFIVNDDGPNEGFNDPTPVAPVGGNPGTTLGQQRLNAFQFAADIWGSILDSDAPIYILSSFDPLPCSATGGTLGAAGAIEAVFSILTLNHQKIFPCLNISEPMNTLSRRPVTEVIEKQHVRNVLSNSFGFGGN